MINQILEEKIRVLANVQGYDIDQIALLIFHSIIDSGEPATRAALFEADRLGKRVNATYYSSIANFVNATGKGGEKIELVCARNKDGSLNFKAPEALEMYADGSFYLPNNSFYLSLNNNP